MEKPAKSALRAVLEDDWQPDKTEPTPEQPRPISSVLRILMEIYGHPEMNHEPPTKTKH
ncbi:MAG: hypothetical protein QM581_06535 [Pseudomonas sp.]